MNARREVEQIRNTIAKHPFRLRPWLVVRDIVHVLRGGPARSGRGWSDPKPLRGPEGAAHVEALCDAFAARDREALINVEIERLTAQTTALQAQAAEAERLKAEIKRVEGALAEVEAKPRRR